MLVFSALIEGKIEQPIRALKTSKALLKAVIFFM